MNYNMCDKFVEYKKQMGYKYKTDAITMNEIKEFLISNKVDVITKEVIDKYVKLNENLKPNTIARNIATFREFCKYLDNQKIECYQIPKYIYKSKGYQYIPYIFSKDEIKLIFKNVEIITKRKIYSYIREQTIPLIIRILYQTGMRVGEVINLKVNNYVEDKQAFLIENSKNGKDRYVYLPNNLNKKVLKYHQKFHNNDNIYFFQLKNNKICINTIEKYFNKTLKLSNIKKTNQGPRIHDLRFTFIVRSIEQAYKNKKDFNIYLPYLMSYVGHSSIKSLEYYFKLTKNMILDINPKIEEELGNIIPKVENENEQ